jgi:DNA gyrase subunit A
MLISDGGTLVRTRVREISVMGRNTQGVRLISLANGEKLVGMERVLEDKDEDDDGDGDASGGGND